MRCTLVTALLLVATACTAETERAAPAEVGVERGSPDRVDTVERGAVERVDALGGRVHELSVGDDRHPPRRVRVWIPEGTSEEAELPVLVVLDGQAAFEEFALQGALGALVRDGTLEPWAVVAIDSTDERRRELAEDAERFGELVVDRVLPAAREVARLATSRDRIAVLGYSYGGLAAVRMQLARPDAIGRVIAMSPSVWWTNAEVLARLRASPGPLPTRLWIDVGTAEGSGIVPGMVRGARALRDAARARGLVFGRELAYLEEPAAAHDMRAVGARALACLAFGLGDVDLAAETPSSLSLYVVPAPRPERRTTFAIGALYRDGRYRLTIPVDLAVVDAARATGRDGATLRAVSGATLRVTYHGARAEAAL